MFNNKFNSSKSDPLVEAVKQAQHDGDLRRQAEAYVNEEFGVYSRQAVVREHLAAYDAALEEAYKALKEGKPNDGNLANNYPPYDKVTRGDVIAGRLGKDQMGGKRKAMEEEMDGLPPSEAAQKAGAKQERETPEKTPERTGNAAGSTISNARGATGLKEAKIKVKGNDPLEARAEYAKKGGPGQVYKKTHSKDKVGMSQADAYAIRNTGPKRGSHLPESIAEAIARKRDIAKGGVTAPIEYADKMGFANPGAISKLNEAWKKLKEAKKEMEEARKCMGEEFDSFDFTNIDEAYVNYIAEAINEYGLQEEHPVVTSENIHMFNESYIAAVLDEAAACEYEKMEKHEKKAKEHKKKMKELDEARMRAEKECNEEELEEAKKWIQSAIKRPGSLSKKLGVPEEKNIPASKLEVKKGDTAATKKQKVLAKTLKHLARKKKMEEELQISEVSHTETDLNPTATGAQATIARTRTVKGWNNPARWENQAKSMTGSMQQKSRTGKMLPPSSELGTPKDEKSTQSFLNKELGRSTPNAQGPEAPSTSKPVPTPPSRPTFSSDLPKIDTGPKLNPQGPGLANQPSSAPKTDVPTPPSRPTMASDLPRIDTGPKLNPNKPGLQESVQVGGNSYRIV